MPRLENRPGRQQTQHPKAEQQQRAASIRDACTATSATASPDYFRRRRHDVIAIQGDRAVPRQQPPVQDRCAGIQRDGLIGQNIPLEGSGGSERRRTADLPKNTDARSGTAAVFDRHDSTARGRGEGVSDLENEDRIGEARAVERQHPR